MPAHNDPPIYLEVCEHIGIRRLGNGTATLVRRSHDLIDSAAVDPAAELGTAPEPLAGAHGNDDTAITDRAEQISQIAAALDVPVELVTGPDEPRRTVDGYPIIATWHV